MTGGEVSAPDDQDVLSALRERVRELEEANERLRHSEERFQALFEHAPDGYYLSDLKGIFVDGNEAAERITGYARSELVGKSFLTLGLISPKDALRAAGLLARNVLGKSTGPDEFTLTRKDGDRIPIEVRTHPITIDKRRLVLGIARDISARRRTERELEERVKELQAFYRLSDIAERKGSSLDELCQELADTLPKSWQHDEVACARVVLRGKEYRSARFAESVWTQSVPVRAGREVAGTVEIFYLEERPEEDEGPFLDEERRLLHAIAERLGRITERKEAEEGLRASESRYRTLFEGSHDAIAAADAETGVIVDCNTAMCEMTGRGKDELVGQPQSILHPPEEQEGAVTRAFTEYKRGVAGHPVEDEIAARNGRRIPVEIRATPVEIAGRSCLLGIFRDITDRKRAEKALKRSMSLLTESQRIAHVGSWELDLQTNELTWSDEVYRIFGLEPHASPATYETFLNLVHPEDREAVDDVYVASLRDHLGSYSTEHRLVRPGTGEVRYVREECIHEWSPSGRAVRSVGIVQDITGRRRAENYRALNTDVLTILNEQSPLEELIPQVVTAVRERIGLDAVGFRLKEGEDYPYFAHVGFTEDFVRAESSLVKRRSNGELACGENGDVTLSCLCGLVISGRGDPSDRHFTQGGSWWTGDMRELLDISPDTDSRRRPRDKCIREGYVSMALIPIRARDDTVGLLQLSARGKGFFTIGAIELLEGTAVHIGEALARREFEEELASMARHDALTGVFNRYALNEMLEREIARSRRYGHPIGFLMIDVNRFKEINDLFGHAMGDKVLQGVADVLKENTRESDLIVRYGGDEFLIVLPETDGETDVVQNRIQAQISQRNETNPLLDFPVTLAIGAIHWSPDSEKTIDQALEDADRRMYEDKRRNSFSPR